MRVSSPQGFIVLCLVAAQEGRMHRASLKFAFPLPLKLIPLFLQDENSDVAITAAGVGEEAVVFQQAYEIQADEMKVYGQSDAALDNSGRSKIAKHVAISKEVWSTFFQRFLRISLSGGEPNGARTS